MAATVYCKKCDCDYPVSERCPCCGAKLGKNAVRVAWWHVDHHPVKDWMCWNGAMRVILPVGALVLALILALEALTGGWAALERMVRDGMIYTLMWILFWTCGAVLALFLAQGRDIMECAADARGVHIRTLIADPTPLKLLVHLRSPRMMAEAVGGGDRPPMVCIAQRDLAWKDVARVQLWPEKTMVLFYAPRWWMRVYLPCTPFTYEDTLAMVREKLGARRKVILPQELAVVKPRPPRSRPVQPRQLRMEDMPPASPPEMDMDEWMADIRAMNAEEEARMNQPDAQ